MISPLASSSTGLVEAINFLTRPLTATHPITIVNALQQILLSTLTNVPSCIRSSRLTLAFTSSVPPRPVYAACVATSFEWSAWFHALGSREFDLNVEPTLVAVHVPGQPRRIIWRRPRLLLSSFVPTVEKAQVPISKFSQSAQSNNMLSINTPPAQTCTLAQKILLEYGNEDVDEIFAMISNLNACTVSPTPTRDCFDIAQKPPATVAGVKSPTYRAPQLSPPAEEIFHSQSSRCQISLNDYCQDEGQMPSPISSPESSRPSSPYSTFSLSSSSQGNLSSVSTRTSTPSNPDAYLSRRCPSKRENPSRRDHAPPIILHTSKKEIQRYLYQGGQSTVLTGGVMLGSSNKSSVVRGAPGPRTNNVLTSSKNKNSPFIKTWNSD